MRLTNRLKVLKNTDRSFLDPKENPIFLLPIGDPIRCALQTLDTGFGFFLTGNHSNSFEEILTGVLDLYEALFQKEKNKKLNFFPLWEHELSVTRLSALCEFVGIAFSQEWAEQVLSIHEEENIPATDQHINCYRDLLNNRFSGLADVKAQFETYLER